MTHPSLENGTARWLIIETNDARKVFVFRPGDEHTIVVGGDDNAHFRLSGVAPVCFYIERFGGELRLAPAYVGHLRVNSSRVTDSVRLPESAVVEFGNYRLYLTVRAVPPSADEATVLVPVPAEADDGAGAFDEDMATCVASFEGEPDAHDAPTTMLRVPGGSSPRHGSILDDDDPAPATQIMGSIPDFDEAFPDYQEPAALRVRPEDPTSADVQVAAYQPAQAPKVALTAANRSDRTLTPVDTHSDRTEGIAFEDFVAPTGKSKAVSPNKNSESTPLETPPPVSGDRTHRPKMRSRERASARTSLRGHIERFGSWAKEKPALAIGGGITGALLIGLAIGGISRALSLAEETKPQSTAISSPQDSAAEPPATEEQPTQPTNEAPEPGPLEDASIGRAERNEEAKPKGPHSKPTGDADAEAEAEALVAEEKAYAEDVNRAVQHLVAGRDDEAAHAYQSLAQTKYASQQLERMSELLQRRTQARQNKKHAAHQVPELYR